MYLAPNLLYLHLPRTAGTFVTNLLEKTGVGSRTVGTLGVHDGVRKISPIQKEDRLIFGSIRDPWSWYVSYYSWFKSPKTGQLNGPIAELCGNRASFEEALRMMTTPHGQGLMVHPKIPGHQNSSDSQIGRAMDKAQIGLWSWYVLTMFCDQEIETLDRIAATVEEGPLPWGADVLADAATIEIGLETVLRSWKGARTKETLDFLRGEGQFTRGAPAINEASSWKGVRPSGGPDPRWWNNDSIRAVLERDGWLMKRFHFDEPVGKRPPLHFLGALGAK